MFMNYVLFLSHYMRQLFYDLKLIQGLIHIIRFRLEMVTICVTFMNTSFVHFKGKMISNFVLSPHTCNRVVMYAGVSTFIDVFIMVVSVAYRRRHFNCVISIASLSALFKPLEPIAHTAVFHGTCALFILHSLIM